MGEYVIKLPDIGEGVAEAELVEWLVKTGQSVREDEALAAVMTDKATVEIPSPVEGKIVWLGPAIGDTVAVGAPIIRLEVVGDGNVRPGEFDVSKHQSEPVEAPPPHASLAAAASTSVQQQSEVHAVEADLASAPASRLGERPIASPAVRARAREAGVDLRHIAGSGPAGRISQADLDAVLSSGTGAGSVAPANRRDTRVEEIRVVGLRRKIAEKMALAKSRIPHITYIDEIDMTALETLRTRLNADRSENQPKLTLLPFLMRAMVRAIAELPQMNALYDDEAGIVHRHGGVHIGIATQTEAGLVVPVVRHAEALGLWRSAREVARLAEAARSGTATRDDLTGSTITITSLGAIGGIATTPVINHPEVAIVGVNKMRVAPVWDGSQFQPRKVMNISSSFDHRIIDGWDAARFVQRIKGLLEAPATIFIEECPNGGS